MKINKLILIVLMLFISLISISNVRAQEEFTNSTQFYEDSIISTPYDPRIACSIEGDCAMVYYDENILGGQGVKFYWYPKGIPDSIFTPAYSILIPNTYDSGYVTAMRVADDDTHFMHDVAYQDGNYYILAQATKTATLYRWNSSMGYTIETVRGMQGSGTGSYSNFQSSAPIGFYFNGSDTIILYLATWKDSSTNYRTYVFNQTIDSSTDIGLTIVENAYPGTGWSAGTSQIWSMGYVAKDQFNYYAKATSSTSSANKDKYASFTFPCSYDALMYEIDNKVFYLNYTTNDIGYTFTDDYDSFGSCTNYTGRVGSREHNISDVAEGNRRFWAHELDVVGGNGFYSFNSSLNLISIISYLEDLSTPEPREFSLVDISATAECGVLNSSDTDTGSLITLSIPCDDVTLQLSNGNGYPTYNELTFNYPGNCDILRVNNNYYNSYDLQLKVIDSITQLPVQNAIVTLTSTFSKSDTTNSQGEAIININPLVGTNFANITNFGSCRIDNYVTGNIRSYDLQVTANNYKNYYSFSKNYANSVSVGNNITTFTFINRDTISLEPDAYRVIVRAVRTDGREVEPPTAEITFQSNASKHLVKRPTDNKFFEVESNSSRGLPSDWLVFSNESSICMNITLDFGTEQTKEICLVNGTNNTITTYFTVDFYCASELDCIDSYCDGTKFYQLNGCFQNKCEYKVENCFNCDDRLGCYLEDSEISCINDYECVNQSSCINDWVSKTGLCGSDGFCKFKQISCSQQWVTNRTGCNNETGLCIQSELCFMAIPGQGGNSYYAGRSRTPFIIQTGAFTGQIVVTLPFITGLPNNFNVLDLQNYLTLPKSYNTPFSAIFDCGTEEIGKRTCMIPPDTNLVDANGSQLSYGTYPTNWEYIRTGSNTIDWKDLSVSCDAGCNVSYEQCDFGCNILTGYCNEKPIEQEQRGLTLDGLIIDIVSSISTDATGRSVTWLIFIVIAVILVVLFTRKFLGTTSIFVGLVTGLAMIIIGLMIEIDGQPLLPIWVFIIFGVQVAFIVLWFFSNIMKGS